MSPQKNGDPCVRHSHGRRLLHRLVERRDLFDEENAPPERRPEKVARAVGRDLAGWTAQLRDRKIAQLASVIAQMNDGTGPDLLGVCEVENRFVLDLLAAAVHTLLPQRTYGIAHANTDDARGIDVAFLYDATQLAAAPEDIFFLTVMNETPPGRSCKSTSKPTPPHLVGVRESLAVAVRRSMGVGWVPRHRRRNPRILARPSP